ncbi:unnamed protein product [Moneuplotes crassus]|uniref:Uncharacterized protein n=1 Tax=Euplotes crassus TaxID=5936 RepID=A0AAD1Y9F1_EUPCR|nr:unnamed protein product [Moneuplotes crassus]
MRKHTNKIFKKIVARTGPTSPIVADRSSLHNKIPPKKLRKSKIKFEKQGSSYTVFSNNSAFTSTRENQKIQSIRNKKESIRSPGKINFHQLDDASDPHIGLPNSNGGSFLSVKTPTTKDARNWETHIEDLKNTDRQKKSRHSKNTTLMNGNTPYSIFLNVQPNISIVRGKDGGDKSNITKADYRRSLMKNKRRLRKSNLMSQNMLQKDASGKLPDLRKHQDFQRGKSAARKRRVFSPNVTGNRMRSIESFNSPQPPRTKKSRMVQNNPSYNTRRPKIKKKSGQGLQKNFKNSQLITFDLSKAKDIKKMRKLVNMQDKIKNVKLTPLKGGTIQNMANIRKKVSTNKKFSSTTNNTFNNFSSTKSRIRVNSIKKTIKQRQRRLKMEKTQSVPQGKTPPKLKHRIEEDKYDKDKYEEDIKDDSLETSR